MHTKHGLEHKLANNRGPLRICPPLNCCF